MAPGRTVLTAPLYGHASAGSSTTQLPPYRDDDDGASGPPAYTHLSLPPLHTHGTLGLYHTSRSDYFIAPHAKPLDARLYYISTSRGMKQPHIKLHPGPDVSAPAIATAMLRQTGPEIDLSPSADPKANFPAGPGRRTERVYENGLLRVRRSFFVSLPQSGKEALEKGRNEIQFEWRSARQSRAGALKALGIFGSGVECIRADTGAVVAVFSETAVAINKIGTFRLLEGSGGVEGLERMVLMSLLCIVEQKRRDGVAIYDSSANVLAAAGPS